VAGDACYGADGDGVIAAEHQGDASALHGAVDSGGELVAGGSDLGEEFGVTVAGGRGFGLLDGDVAKVVDVIAKGVQARIEIGDAEGGGSHVDAAAALAEIEGGADDGYAGVRHKKPSLLAADKRR
jgi:hypothetical protein